MDFSGANWALEHPSRALVNVGCWLGDWAVQQFNALRQKLSGIVRVATMPRTAAGKCEEGRQRPLGQYCVTKEIRQTKCVYAFSACLHCKLAAVAKRF